jgi:glycosyltransferase involved in cell wall biosynthesis
MLAERAAFLPYDTRFRAQFAFNIGWMGVDLSTHPAIQAADIVHLHWVANGFQSLQTLHRLLTLGKPVVWTCHDQWAFTGGCFYSEPCYRFENTCGECPMLAQPRPNDLSSWGWTRRAAAYEGSRLAFVASSDWLADLARRSSLAAQRPVYSIANPIDLTKFVAIPQDQARLRLHLPLGKKLFLFGSAKLADPRKGFDFLKAAFAHAGPAAVDWEVIVYGHSTPADLAAAAPVPVRSVGFLRNEEDLSAAYAAADAMVLPSVADNLPNTVMESLACGTPVVAFATGGIPQLIQHGQTGWLAPVRDVRSLAQGLAWASDTGLTDLELRHRCREYVRARYTYPLIAQKYTEVYEHMLT